MPIEGFDYKGFAASMSEQAKELVPQELEDREKEYIVKRVIGLPNEKVSYVDDQLYINDQPVEEPFLNTEYKNSYNGTFTDGVLETTLGDDEYYCLGDNRPNSKDSRYYGPFSVKNISSKGILILWPLQSINLLTW